jgi:hypothetical protein
VVFVRGWLPETKGHSVDEIIGLFEKHAVAEGPGQPDAGPGAASDGQ